MYSALTKCNRGWLSAHCASVKVWEGTHTCLTVQFSHCTVCYLHIHALTHTCVRAERDTANWDDVIVSMLRPSVHAHSYATHPALKYWKSFKERTNMHSNTQIQKYLCVWFHRKSWLLKTYRTLAKQLASTSSDNSLCTLYSVKKKKNFQENLEWIIFSLLWLQAETK